MKLSELKPCGCCSGPLLKPPCGSWYCLRMSIVILNPRAARGVIGLTTILGGALGIAEVLAPDADGAVVIAGDKEPELMEEIHVCFDCMTSKLAPIFEMFQQSARRDEQITELTAAGAGGNV